MNNTMNTKGVGLALLVILIWGINFSFIKYGLEELPPILFSALRFLIVAIPAIFFIPFPKTSVWNVLGVGVFLGVLQFSLLFIAMREDVTAGLASLILQAQVLFTIVLSIIIFKDKISMSQSLGVLVAGLGFSVFLFNSSGNATFLGVTLIIAAGFFWSISNVIMKKVKGVNLLHFMVWVCVVPPVPLFALSFFLESQDPVSVILSTTLPTWLSLIFVSYISTLLAFSIWGWLLRTFPVASVTPFALLIPVFGIAASSVLLNEKLSSLELIGTVIILSGLVLCSLGDRIVQAMRSGSTPVAR